MFLDVRLANSPRWYICRPRDADMRVPDSILRSVAFIGVPEGTKTARTTFTATGFFVEVLTQFEPKYRFRYFVTAAHVARKIYDGRFTVSLNDPLTLNAFEVSGEDVEWYFHPDKAVDVAITPWFPEDAAHEPIPASMIMPDDPLKAGGWLGVGDEVMIAGLYTRFHGVVRNWPIIRIGNIAMLPDEKHKTKLGDAYLYLVEARSTGGLSGSPVFARETAYSPVSRADGSNRLVAGGGEIFLIGLVHGHHDDRSGRGGQVNMGIAEVTPAERIMEVINLPELIKMRKEFTDEKAESETATMDYAEKKPRKTRDIEIPPISRDKFIGELTKATKRLK
jgi:hypothetical protein